MPYKLLRAAEKGKLSEVKRLVKKEGCDVNETGTFTNESPIIAAIENGHPKVVEWLLKKGASTSSYYRNSLGQSALELAIMKGSTAILIYLYKYGLPLEERVGTESCTALHLVFKHKQAKMVRMLLERGVPVNEKTQHGQTALMMAAANGELESTKLLLQNGASISEKDVNACTPLLWAAQNGHLMVVQLLIKSGASIAEEDASCNTALHLAAVGNHSKLARWLLEQGVSSDKKNSDGKTALDLAKWRGHSKCMAVIRKATQSEVGVETSLNKEKETSKAQVYAAKTQSIHDAARTGDIEAIKAQISRMSNKNVGVNERDEYGYTPIFWAAGNGHLDALQLLLHHGAIVGWTTELGNTAFLWAAFNGQLEIIQYLLEHNVSITESDKSGNTALLQAASNGHLKTVHWLLQHGGVSIHETNSHGQTAVDLAKYQDWYDRHEKTILFLNYVSLQSKLRDPLSYPKKKRKPIGYKFPAPNFDLSSLSTNDQKRWEEERALRVKQFKNEKDLRDSIRTKTRIKSL